MKKTQFLWLFCLFFVLTANSQTKTENRTIGTFSKIESSGSSKIILVSSDSNTLTLEGDEKSLQYLVTEVKGNTLKIYYESSKKISFKGGSVTVRVPFKKLDGVSLSGSGNISSDATIKTDNFAASLNGSGKINLNVASTGNTSAKLDGSGKLELYLATNKTNAEINGSGKLTLKGKTSNFTGNVNGSGQLNASEFTSETSDVSVHGSGNLMTATTGTLTANVHGSGTVKYNGEPKKINKNVNGSGKVSKS
ncbi:putative autotransporter adhesin-like protein [Flavobacterium endophyticum]|uniref:Putative autotransporter adhesin-like protein n=1 Tax=Flavobacterium endophyticum TaxID=1540163 RepID=A0A495M593_9FLAO|nr:head GIN domain-containing protein [Flavobacterium endophyticum]RKS20485.1 putative autotransporter adhesin-like protein [Flavobacterium endophyticum]